MLSMDDFDTLVILISNCVEQKKSYRLKQYMLRVRRRRREILVFSLYRNSNLVNTFIIDYRKKTFYLQNKLALESESIADVLTICLDFNEEKEENEEG